MGIELKNKQKEVLLSILEKFYSENGDFSSLCEGLAGELSETEEYAFHYGASKGVIIPLKEEDRSIFPYVIKIPFLYEDEEYETKIVNHCRLEQKNSIAAAALGLSDILIPTEYFGRFASAEIYIQQRVESLKKAIIRNSWDILSEKYGVNQTGQIDPNLSLHIIEYYGLKKFFELVEFVEEKRINDLHGGNYGFIDGRPVIFDYSGYYGADYSSSTLSSTGHTF